MLEISDLSKSFKIYKKNPGLRGSLRSFFHREYIINSAVNSFSMNIEPGEFVGLLGPNGAGKTTLMKMMTGIIVPSSGNLKVLGFEPFQRDKSFRRKIALVMGQKSQLWWDIPALDSLYLLQKYYEIEDSIFHQRMNELSELLGVQKVMNTHVRKLSLGERMKLELMASLLHGPEILFLDEPTIGLDLVAQQNIRKFLKEYHHKNNCTVILTSHYMADVEALCKRIVLILDGKKSFDGSLENFSKILGKDKFVTFYFSTPVLSRSFFEGFEPYWSENFKKVEMRISEDQLREVCRQILEEYPVVDFSTEKIPIEKVMSSILENPSIVK